jgi:ubiquinone/menaquinone biosynthesis C-methylase UbiE
MGAAALMTESPVTPVPIIRVVDISRRTSALLLDEAACREPSRTTRFGSRSETVLDVGCGTGTLACQLAARGIDVIAVDPAAASLEVAAGKPHADRVRWLVGDATALPAIAADLATMTGNVAQVFLSDAAWAATLVGVHRAIRSGGQLVFEARDPARRGWEEWTRERSYRRITLPSDDVVETWVDLTEVNLPFVSFRTTFVFDRDGAVLTSESTLRFRSHAEIDDSLRAAGFT